MRSPSSILSRSWVLALLVTAAVPVVGLAGPARAACHAFDVTAAPASVAEGGAVSVTVTRDGSSGPSSVDVETVDGTAKAGSDYDRVPRRTIAFTNDRSQTFQVNTRDDAEQETAESFRLHLSNPAGCSANPNYDVGPDATVTIAANDQSATTTRPPATTTTARPAGTTVQTPPSTTASPTVVIAPGPTNFPPITTSSTVSATIAVATPDDGGDSKGPIVLGLVVLGAALAAAGGWWTYRRRTVTVDDPDLY